MRKRGPIDSLSYQPPHLRRKTDWLVSGKRALMLSLGAALSFGGVAEVFEKVQFIVRTDSHSVRVINRDERRTPAGASIAARSLSVPRKPGSRELPFGDIIHQKSRKYDVDPALVAAVMETESRFQKDALSQVGAQGLMQLMPRTGRWLGARNLYDPEQNVDAGAKYLKYLSKRFDGNLRNTIAAYNAGEGVVRRYGGVPPYQETRSYVQKVLRRYQQRHRELMEESSIAADPS